MPISKKRKEKERYSCYALNLNQCVLISQKISRCLYPANWTPPPGGSHKLNFDGSFHPTDGTARIWGVLRDDWEFSSWLRLGNRCGLSSGGRNASFTSGHSNVQCVRSPGCHLGRGLLLSFETLETRMRGFLGL